MCEINALLFEETHGISLICYVSSILYFANILFYFTFIISSNSFFIIRCIFSIDYIFLIGFLKEIKTRKQQKLGFTDYMDYLALENCLGNSIVDF